MEGFGEDEIESILYIGREVSGDYGYTVTKVLRLTRRGALTPQSSRFHL